MSVFKVTINEIGYGTRTETVHAYSKENVITQYSMNPRVEIIKIIKIR